jgi:hypothetical protein
MSDSNRSSSPAGAIDAIRDREDSSNAEIHQDLWGEWRLWRRRDNRSWRDPKSYADEAQAAERARTLAAARARKNKGRQPHLATRLGEQAALLQDVLLAYCEARERRDGGAQISLFGRSDAVSLQAELVERILALLGGDGSVGDLQARAAVRQSLSLWHSRSAMPSNVVALVPRPSHSYLDFTIGSFLGDLDCRLAIAQRLRASGIVRVGHLVQRTESEIARIVETPSHMLALSRCLAEAGLCFGMRAPGWRAARHVA